MRTARPARELCTLTAAGEHARPPDARASARPAAAPLLALYSGLPSNSLLCSDPHGTGGRRAARRHGAQTRAGTRPSAHARHQQQRDSARMPTGVPAGRQQCGARLSWRAARACNDDDAGPRNDAAVEHGKVYGRADQAEQHGHRHEAPEPAQVALDYARDLRSALPCPARAPTLRPAPGAALPPRPSCAAPTMPRRTFLCLLAALSAGSSKAGAN